MADLLGMDPARIARLRSPERLEYFHPDRIWEVLEPTEITTLIDIGAGVGYLTLPFASRYPKATVYGCDILEGMVGLLQADAAERRLDNVHSLVMQPASVALPNDAADIIVMGQLHHELDDPDGLMAECKRLLRPGGTIAIIDWADADNGKSPPAGRRVPVSVMRTQLEGAGFNRIETHTVFEYHTFMTGRG